MKQFVAHVKQNHNGGWEDPHLLEEHLLDVAKMAKEFAEKFNASDWAELSGLWHDLGKYQIAFQIYIREQSGFEAENAHIEQATGRVTHSTAGAIHAVEKLGRFLGHIIAYLISGHHAGLPDWDDGGKGSLKFRLKDGLLEYQSSLSELISNEILDYKNPELPEIAKSVHTIALWMRMLFSCLVDADFLDTEKYMSPDKSMHRDCLLSINDLHQRFSKSMALLKKDSVNHPINQLRQDIQATCISAATFKPGIFSLTVPTGGGKTLSSLAFALEHAKIFNKKRIIYAIPFTSIIEQNAKVFCKILGEDAVLEHHSNLDIDLKHENFQSRLASENWDFPLIVTTNVQLFESLFSSRTSRCRKLHNLIDSVIILDEAQQLPRDFHAPITQVMQQLTDFYGVTWLLCTATQPDLGHQKDVFNKILLQGLNNVREIIPDPIDLARKLQRVNVIMPEPDADPVTWEEIADQVADENCVLAIVNTRLHARKLYELLPQDGNNLHLSANMCAEHRTVVLNQIRQRLKDRENGNERPLRVVSTQLIEAGVDVDFPTVYRALAGLDSIAQAAGRCNREGKMSGLGKVVVFRPKDGAPVGFLRQAEQITYSMLKSALLDDPLSPEKFNDYFRRLNTRGERDKHGICDLLTAKETSDAPLILSFRTASEKFRYIDNNGVSIIVPYLLDTITENAIETYLSMLEKDSSKKWIYRKLQRYSVTIPEKLMKALIEKGALYSKAGQWVLLDCYYHDVWGVQPPDTLLSAEEMVI